MKNSDFSYIWELCLDVSKRRMPLSTFQSWLSESHFESVEENYFYIRFPNEFMAKWSKGHYGNMLQEIFEDISGLSDFQLMFIGDRSENQRPVMSVPRIRIANEYLHPGYTFERFVLGKSNELAYAGAQSVAKEFGHSRYNPLFVYGGVGLGKTHLMQAIGHFVRQNYPDKNYRYISSERFTQDLISAMMNKNTNDFRNEYKSVDLLLMDDVQFLAGKERTQEEFFHRFNELYQNGKQIVLTSDRPPFEINDLEKRLVSRFQSGLVADIQHPDFETRLAILEQKVNEENINFPLDVLEFIATVIKENIRQLEGAINRISASPVFNQGNLTVDEAKILLKDFLPDITRIISPGSIIAAVAESFQVSPSLIRGKQRKREYLIPRQISMYLIRELTDISLVEIGNLFSGRDHSTVLHSTEKIRQTIEVDHSVKRRIASIQKQLRG